MSKKEELLFDHDGQISIEDRQDERGPCEVPYSAPPNEDAKWKALVAIGAMPKWNGTMKGDLPDSVQQLLLRQGLPVRGMDGGEA